MNRDTGGDTANGRNRVVPDRSSIRIREGVWVAYRKEVYRITHFLDTKNVVGINAKDGRASVLPISKLKHVGGEDIPSSGDVLNIGEEEWKVVEKRLSAIAPLLDGAGRREVEKRAEETGIHYTTLYRWIRRYLEGGGVTGLLPRKEGYPAGRKRMDPFVENVMREVIDTFYLSRARPKVQEVIRKVKAVCLERGLPAPSPGTVRNRIVEISELEKKRRRYGTSAARDRFSPTPGKFTADYPMHIVQMDHTLADIILVDSETREPVGRPWLTVAIDIHTRMIAGYHLSFDDPSSVSVGMCVLSCISPKDEMLREMGIEDEWPLYGFMDTLHVDNGADFRSDALARACRAHGITLDFRPVRKTHYGGHVERVIGTLMGAVHELPGTTYSRPGEKGKEYDPDASASMTLEEFEKWLVSYIVKIYHKRTHAGLEMSPEEKFREAFFAIGGLPPKASDLRSVMIDFLPAFSRTIQRSGVRIDGISYYDPVLRFHIGETDGKGRAREFLFRRDPRDISYIWFYSEEEKCYYRINAADQSLPRMSVWEMKRAKEKLRGGRGSRGDERDIVAAHEKLRELGEASKKNTRKARREKERKRAHRRHVAATVPPEVRPGPLPPSEDEGLWDGEIPEYDIEPGGVK